MEISYAVHDCLKSLFKKQKLRLNGLENVIFKMYEKTFKSVKESCLSFI